MKIPVVILIFCLLFGCKKDDPEVPDTEKCVIVSKSVSAVAGYNYQYLYAGAEVRIGKYAQRDTNEAYSNKTYSIGEHILFPWDNKDSVVLQ